MISQAVSPLRRQMIEEVNIRRFGGKTKNGYIQQVRRVVERFFAWIS